MPEEPDQAALLTIDALAIRHEGAPVVRPDGAGLRIERVETVLLLGPSGCGKSTMALAINGLIPHAIPAEMHGEVHLAGRNTRAVSVAELSTSAALVFQDPDSQVVTGTLLDEVCFGPENLTRPVAEILADAERALRRVGLWDRRSENPDLLSGGGRQRLAIACALAMRSPLLVLDEPTANLDPAGAREVYDTLAELAHDGHSILLIEHNLDEAVRIADRVVVLDAEGHRYADGPVTEILSERAEELHTLGVWLPTATHAARTLRRHGIGEGPPPLTIDALRAELRALDAAGALPPLNAPRARPVDAADPVIRIRGLDLDRGRSRVLHDITLDIGRGEFLAVLGTNGAGKTSLIQAIAGVLRPPRGTIAVDGTDPSRRRASALTGTVGFVFQNPEHQFVTPTVAEELAHGLRGTAEPGEIARRVDDMLDRFGLSAHRDVHPFQLSGGQKRRLSVGTALITSPAVLLLDEPTFGQDRERAEELLGLLRGLHAEGTTVIIVSHDLQLVAEYASHIAVLDDGRLRTHGPADTVLADEALLRDAGLLPPPLHRAFAELQTPGWSAVHRYADLPGASA